MKIIKWFELELRSLYLRRMLSYETQQKNSVKREEQRRRENRLHTVYYFHEVNDPYSHLCAQILKPLTDNYEIDSFDCWKATQVIDARSYDANEA